MTSTAVEVVRRRALHGRSDALARWHQLIGASRFGEVEEWASRLAAVGRITLNFHPDRVTARAPTVSAGLLADGRYRSQWVTGISNGSRSAIAGGERQRFERALFDSAYDTAEPGSHEFPVYGALDLLWDPHGGSPRFGSSYLVLSPDVRTRTTLCVGDSHVGPRDVGTFDATWCLLAGLAEQAAAGSLLDRSLGLEDLVGALDGDKVSAVPSRSLDGYIEAQVHGGVDLAADVEAIVLDPSFAGTDTEHDLTAAAQRYGFEIGWHAGSNLAVDDVPTDFRGPTMAPLARRVARPDGVVDARSIGVAARRVHVEPPLPHGDPPEGELQRLKYLWHTVLAYGTDAVPRTSL
ncbi:MAG TPA: DUF3626 domain-containing protein [Acidimicrobiales bacterium]|nr:DUF3626 domain-containing protein [Acidimicrobiales bacterium]